MSAAILAIGTELTRGELVNGNARWLGERLTELGFTVAEHVTVPDDAERIRGTLLRLGQGSKVIVCTGGLGPTSDDLTSQAVADALGVTLVRDAASLAKIEALYRSRNRVMPAMNAKQADFPQGARILPNDLGTASGFAVQIGGAQAFFTPGVPREMQFLFDTHIAPQIAELAQPRSHQVHIRTYGLYESAVAQRLQDLDRGGAQHDPRVTIGYRVTFPEVEVKVLAEAESQEVARALAERVSEEVRTRLSDVAFGGKNESYPRHVAGMLERAGLKVALAESCTGGLTAKLLTDIAGSSAYVIGGAVSYANTAKVALLGVSEALLREQGAVNEAVAREMAEGALQKLGADLAVGITGIAGPGGGSPSKPVGTVCFALARRDAPTRTLTEVFPGERENVRTFAAYRALRLIAGVAAESLDAAKSTRGS
ncbi:MAG TPA: competence/damage-inducible protein A [Polyangiales bacterium]|nr:competence/damage-inducible protein A [Polyangiales bacterium]